jgi:hypothetical protein
MNPNGHQMRARVETLLEDTTIPTWEKMRILQIEFGSVIAGWFAEDPDPYKVTSILLRKDCISIEDDLETNCTNMCAVKDGKCKIHTPTTLQIRTGPNVDAVLYFTTRLFDEILRLPIKRQELFSNSVKRIQVPSTNIHLGDHESPF